MALQHAYAKLRHATQFIILYLLLMFVYINGFNIDEFPQPVFG